MFEYYDYKCELEYGVDSFVIDVYEDADFVARFEIKGIFHKRLKLIQTKRLIKDIGSATKYAQLYFEAIKHLI